MKKESGYNTSQKEKLLDFLINNKDKHTSVQEIDAYLRDIGSPVGMATIYRQLDRLVSVGCKPTESITIVWPYVLCMDS